MYQSYNIYSTDLDKFYILRSGFSSKLNLSGISELNIPFNFILSNDLNSVSFDTQNSSFSIGNNKFAFTFDPSGQNSKMRILQFENNKSLNFGLGSRFLSGYTYIDDIVNIDSMSGKLNIDKNLGVSGTGFFNAIDLNNIDNLNLSGVDIYIQDSIVDLGNSQLINFIPEIISLSNNFLISGNYNARTILVNSNSPVTGYIVSGNSKGFNAHIIQVGNGSIQVTGSGNGIIINSYNNQYGTAGKYAKISIINTGNNGYIIAGNTA